MGIATDKDSIVRLGEEIEALIAGIKALDKEVADATANRKAENSEYKATMGADKAAKELIGLAKNRMMQFYNPALYTPAPKIELSREQRIAVNEGSEAAPTVAPSGIADLGCLPEEGRGAKRRDRYAGLAHCRPRQGDAD